MTLWMAAETAVNEALGAALSSVLVQMDLFALS
jgi:hypothetical protein